MAVRVFLAHHSPTVIHALKALLRAEGFEIAGEAADAEGAVTGAVTLQPDVAILDLAMPGKGGVQATREIRALCPAVGTILLAAHEDRHLVMAALRAGARGFVDTSEAPADLPRAIRSVSQGRVFVSPCASCSLVDCWVPDLAAPGRPSQQAAAGDAAADIPASGSRTFPPSPPGFTD